MMESAVFEQFSNLSYLRRSIRNAAKNSSYEEAERLDLQNWNSSLVLTNHNGLVARRVINCNYLS